MEKGLFTIGLQAAKGAGKRPPAAGGHHAPRIP